MASDARTEQIKAAARAAAELAALTTKQGA